jgi:hypothetical protein
MSSTLAVIRIRRSAVLATAVLLFAMYCLTALASPAKAAVRDSDHDGMPNRWERTNGLNPSKANANANPDHDGLVNVGEFTFGTDPLESDSDDDGIVDGDEDANDDGVADGDEDGNDDGDLAGTIATFVATDATTGVLTLDISAGGQVTGTVTDGTELEWDGDCDGDSGATTADLVAGTGVNELEFVDGSTIDLESVALACAGGDDEGDD